MTAIDTRPAIKDTRCCDDRRRGLGFVEVREDVCDLDIGGLAEPGELAGLIGVIGLDEAGDWAGESESGSEVIVTTGDKIEEALNVAGM